MRFWRREVGKWARALGLVIRAKPGPAGSEVERGQAVSDMKHWSRGWSLSRWRVWPSPAVVHAEGGAHPAAANGTFENLRQRWDDLDAPRVWPPDQSLRPRPRTSRVSMPDTGWTPLLPPPPTRPLGGQSEAFPGPVSVSSHLINLNGFHGTHTFVSLTYILHMCTARITCILSLACGLLISCSFCLVDGRPRLTGPV